MLFIQFACWKQHPPIHKITLKAVQFLKEDLKPCVTNCEELADNY